MALPMRLYRPILGPPAPARGMNVSLSNFTLNGNQGNGSTEIRPAERARAMKESWYFGINLMNLDNIDLENVVVVNTPAYHIRLSNVGNVVVSGCVMQSHGFSTDGLHFDGPANDITISNCDFTTGDDSIALNCPEGYSGNISRVTVTNCTFNSRSLMRLYTIMWWNKYRNPDSRIQRPKDLIKTAAGTAMSVWNCIQISKALKAASNPSSCFRINTEFGERWIDRPYSTRLRCSHLCLRASVKVISQSLAPVREYV